MTDTVILWFRQDLRLNDLPALQAASRDGRRVLPLYIFDEDSPGDWVMGGASRWWLHHSLSALARDIEDQGGKLIFRRGKSREVLGDICKSTDATAVYCSRRYEPWASEEEKMLHEDLGNSDIDFKRYGGTLLHEPGNVMTQSGGPYKVFTPFWRACLELDRAEPVPVPDVTWSTFTKSDALDDWQLRPTSPNWAASWEEYWTPGEDGAQQRLHDFLEESVSRYADERDFPAEEVSSRLSPHLHHGELSPRQVWAMCEQKKLETPASEKAIKKFQAEIGWREFSYHLLHFFPEIPEKAFKENFADFPWQPDKTRLERWQQGQTGYPIVDAGMRELWATGTMHNRIRMVVASFLCKHLLQHWRSGEDWFWDTLVDADMASNGCSWQWVAGSGADAAPYFRIFNPITQGEKFDKHGDYVRQWVPEIARLPNKYLHKPWEASKEALEEAGIKLGSDYPEPIVDHKEARQAALDAYEDIKGSNTSSS
ncbi:cryptochrome/photolyase family protein [Congregibacter litoralis]|uniref:Deoxyribodipyrimidine photo-lyase n=1 Tax=Congregibacter litoralis KT71 TaxID=314285 RepID=A4A8B3_9GAMM|nr:deoxyribodipyrimidine photo-lyase [Congregibacter litoralis]EAQ97908.1 deoxyribodipyrimidine photo-lyase type I [Congregibacter litoralis KT71]